MSFRVWRTEAFPTPWNINKFIVFVCLWKPIEVEFSQMIEEEFVLPYFEFVYDEHWDLGHGWSGDM